MTFPNDVNHNVVTKTVVLEAIKGDVAPTPAHFNFSNPDIQENVKEGIYKFLYSRRLNRLTSPHNRLITNYNSLLEWHEENEEIKREARNENIKGTYDIFYKQHNGFTTDKLSIEENIEADLVAYYSHEVDRGKPQKWLGNVSYSPITRAVFISLQGSIKKQSNIENISTIFLILNIPSGERDFNVLTGIISGIKDDYAGSIGMLVVAAKHSDGYDPNKEGDLLSRFFETYSGRASILPPGTPIATFDDLEKSISEG